MGETPFPRLCFRKTGKSWTAGQESALRRAATSMPEPLSRMAHATGTPTETPGAAGQPRTAIIQNTPFYER